MDERKKQLTIGRNIQAELARRNMTRTQLATTLGMGPAALRRRMQGKQPWRLSELQYLSFLFDMTVDQLGGSVGGAAPTPGEMR